MDKIEELKQKLEELKQEKINNEKVVTKIQRNDIHIIEQELEGLNTLMSNIKKAKKEKTFGNILVYLNLNIAFNATTLMFDGNIPIGIYIALMLSSCIGGALSMVWSTLNSRFLTDHKDENIQSQIEEKEKQKELTKKNSKSNEQKLSELNKRQVGLDLEIKSYESRILIYEEATKQLVSEYMDSLQFLEKRDTKVREISIGTQNNEIELSKCDETSKQVTDDLVKRIAAKIVELEKETSNSSNETEENSKDIIGNNFIQIIYDEKLYNIPFDQYIMLCIQQQDDIEIKLKNNCIVRDGKNDEETFKINNALRRGYLNRLSKLNINDDVKEYLKRYDIDMEYNDHTSIISIKTMVNELAYIYYLEYTNKYNHMDLVSENLNTVRLDKGLDKTLIKKIR